jgi:hypothetical protein
MVVLASSRARLRASRASAGSITSPSPKTEDLLLGEATMHLAVAPCVENLVRIRGLVKSLRFLTKIPHVDQHTVSTASQRFLRAQVMRSQPVGQVSARGMMSHVLQDPHDISKPFNHTLVKGQNSSFRILNLPIWSGFVAFKIAPQMV